MLGQAHARMGRHFKRPHFNQPQPPIAGFRRIELIDAKFRAMRIAGDIDQQMAKETIY
jgi:hypothetical protein